MKLKIKIKDKEYEVEVTENPEGVEVKIGDKKFLFENEKNKEVLVSGTLIPKRSFAQKEIIAPISGVISEISVKQGDFVKKNQKILTLTSMKMANEIMSDFEGVVKDISVKKGQEVKIRDILIVLK